MNFKKVIPILIVALALILIYNSKRGYYRNKTNFYSSTLNVKILKIKDARGTKVYYSEEDFFYLESCEDIHVYPGDSISKVGSKIKVFRNKTGKVYVLAESGKAIKPKDSYFNFFFNL